MANKTMTPGGPTIRRGTSAFTITIASITQRRVSVDDLLQGDPRDLAEKFTHFLQTPTAGVTISADDRLVVVTAIRTALDFLNNLPHLRRYEAALEALQDHSIKDSNTRARIAANRLLGRPDRSEKRGTYDAAEIVAAYRYFTVGVAPSEQSGGDFLALCWSEQAEAEPPLAGLRAIEAITRIFHFASLHACLQFLKAARSKLSHDERFKLPAISPRGPKKKKK